MDLIKLFSTTAEPTELSQGVAVNGWTSLLWVEKYQDHGEFQIVAPLSSGLMDFLPINTFLTHLNTEEVMIVESLEPKNPKDKDGTVTISGRSFTSFLEQRSVGDDFAFSSDVIGGPYVLGDLPSWEQAVNLIWNHYMDVGDPKNRLPGMYVGHTCSGPNTSEERHVKPRPVWDQIIELLKIDDTGIKMVRPTGTDELTYFIIYQGVDRSASIRFSTRAGDLEDVGYLFTNKKFSNYARVVGRWLQTLVGDSGPAGLHRRALLVDASDLDNEYSSVPSGGTATLILSQMDTRGREALAKANQKSITQADVAPGTQYLYREDYNLGDLVTVDGDFGASATMRVTEYAEVEDENGTRGHPTLSIPGED